MDTPLNQSQALQDQTAQSLPPHPSTSQPQSQMLAESPVLIQVPLWKNPRLIFAAGVALLVIIAGAFFSSSSKGLKGSFDSYDPAVDYKITTFEVAQAPDNSIEMTYKIEKDASNLFMAITKAATDDKPENDEMVKLIALVDADLKSGEHKIQVTAEDVKAAFTTPGTYRFQIIAYNEKDEITDFKSEKRTATVEGGKVTLK